MATNTTNTSRMASGFGTDQATSPLRPHHLMPHSSATARQEEEAKASAAAAVSAAASSAAAAAASAAAASAAVAAATAADAISTAQRSMSTLRVWMACTQVVRSSCQTVFSRLRQIQSSFSAVEAVAAAHREALKVAEATVAVAQPSLCFRPNQRSRRAQASSTAVTCSSGYQGLRSIPSLWHRRVPACHR